MASPARPERLIRKIALAATVSLAVGLAGCSAKQGAAAAPLPAEEIPLQISNHNYLDITIYAVHDGQLTRLGVAGGSAHTAMVLPARLLGAGRELRLYGDPVGSSERAITETVVVQPGQYVEWLLEPGLDRSTISVY
jgi:hypothetical protein